MSLLTKLSDLAASAAANPVAVLANGGSIKLYNGTRPTNANSAVGSQTLLASFTLPSPAFTTATHGQLTAHTISPVTASGTGVATWYRMENSGGSAIMDGNVGATGTTNNLTLNSTSIGSGQSVTITAFILQCNEQGS